MLSSQARSLPPTRRNITSNWLDIYFAAVLESDDKLALAKIQTARKVLQDRLLELHSVPNSPIDEQRDLHSALTYLEILFFWITEDPPGTRMAAVA
jgi:hypothetical protein